MTQATPTRPADPSATSAPPEKTTGATSNRALVQKNAYLARFLHFYL